LLIDRHIGRKLFLCPILLLKDWLFIRELESSFEDWRKIGPWSTFDEVCESLLHLRLLLLDGRFDLVDDFLRLVTIDSAKK